MISEFFSSLRHVDVAGLNALEWFGAVSAVSFFIYFVGGVRNTLSGSGSRKRAKKRGRLSEIPKKSVPAADLPHGSETVLIVDDDLAVLKAHSRLVSKLGYRVERALGGQAAIDFIQRRHADLIILDLLMPDVDGIDTLRAIKKINPAQRAIVLSGFAGPAMVNAIKTLGAGSYLVKPAQISFLARAIREEIDRDED